MENIIAGDTLELEYTFDDYSASEYDIWIALRGQSAIDIKSGESGVTITNSGDTFVITVTAAETATWTIGNYWYQIYVGQSNFTTRYTVEEGSTEIEQSFSTITSTLDNRSHVKKVLDAIESVIEGRATSNAERYTIAGRTLDKTPIPDLLKLKEEYEKLYNLEIQQEKIDAGEEPGNLVKVVL